MRQVGYVVAVCLLSGCSTTPQVESYGSSSTVVLRETINELEKEAVPGTVNEVYIEPMYDTITMPGQIDPSNTYYRKPHKTVVEIRHGKYQKVEYPRADGNYAAPEPIQELKTEYPPIGGSVSEGPEGGS